MSPLLVATRSRGKQAEFRALLAPLGFDVVFPGDVGIAESVAEAALEPFDTFEANARSKARWFQARAGLATLADDSGLEVDALGGAPGVQSKRFAGLDGPDDVVAGANNALLLQRLAGVRDAGRTARYRCVLVLVGADGVERVADGTAEGRIVPAPRGSLGFGYDPLFLSDELGKTFGEASAVEKAGVSHRGRAVAALGRILKPGALA